jgi:SEC-C motif domain protein
MHRLQQLVTDTYHRRLRAVPGCVQLRYAESAHVERIGFLQGHTGGRKGGTTGTMGDIVACETRAFHPCTLALPSSTLMPVTTKTKSAQCLCHSGTAYALCCRPLHRADQTAQTPTALMRSRYCAFALGLGEYLYTTLAKTHEHRLESQAAFCRSLRHDQPKTRYMGLTILDAHAQQVLFFAKLFIQGRDCSFAELSTFTTEDGALRYASGSLLSAKAFPAALKAALAAGTAQLSCDAFLQLAAASGEDAS